VDPARRSRLPDVEHTISNPTPTSDHRLKAFFRVSELWNLTADQQITLLGGPARSTFFKWKKDGGDVSNDTEERISHVVSVFKALQILFPRPEDADGWLRKPNRYFDGRSALEVMLDGKLSDLYHVRAYVDAQRGG
jgi:uncharacterized protein (DUF2384 family)